MSRNRSIIGTLVDVVIVTGMAVGMLFTSLWLDLIVPAFRRK